MLPSDVIMEPSLGPLDDQKQRYAPEIFVHAGDQEYSDDHQDIHARRTSSSSSHKRISSLDTTTAATTMDVETAIENPLLSLPADPRPVEYERGWKWWRKTRQLTRWKIRAPVNPRSIRFLVMSYGTRGDVQPYISLCLILMGHGHQCRIATHTDYKDWIESFGIQHAPLCGKGDLIKDFMASLTQNGITNLKNLKMVYLLGKFFHQAFVDGWAAAKDGNQDVILGVG